MQRYRSDLGSDGVSSRRRMSAELRRFLKDETGAELVEWAVVTAILLMATAGVLLTMRGLLRDIFINALSELAAP